MHNTGQVPSGVAWATPYTGSVLVYGRKDPSYIYSMSQQAGGKACVWLGCAGECCIVWGPGF